MQFWHRWLIGLAALAIPVAAESPVPPLQAPISDGQALHTLLVDLSSGQTLHASNFAENEAHFRPASITKVMTAMVVFDQIKAGKLSEGKVVTVRPETAAKWAGKGTSLSLRANEQVRIGDLLLGTTAASANDGAIVLAEASAGSVEAFVGLMNARAKQLGMNRSLFANPNGFPDNGETHVTARDLVTLAGALIEEHQELYRRYFGQPGIRWRGNVLPNRDPITGIIPGADGIKTGFTREAGFNFLGSLERDGRRLVLVIGGARSEAERASAARTLAEWGFSDWESRSLAPQDWLVGEAVVQEGSKRSVRLALPRAASFSRPIGREGRLKARIVYDGPLKAPIRKGTAVAQLELRLDRVRPWTVPLVAAEDVAKAGPIDRIVNGLLGLFE